MLLCFFSKHQWTKWEYFNDLTCEQRRNCTNCQAKESKQLHRSFTIWKFNKPGSCKQERICTHCNTVEKRTLHTWGETIVAYKKTHAHQICARCGQSRNVENPLQILSGDDLYADGNNSGYKDHGMISGLPR